jgi:hypothetical protein
MLPRSVVLSALALGVALAPLVAFAQPAGPASGGTPDVLPPASGAAAAGSAAPAEGDDKKAPSRPMAGYAYSDKPAAAAAPRAHYRTRGPVVTMPGFEQTSDGGSRLFVQLSQPVQVEERRAAGSVTYVLKGASPRVWNNTNALVTVHFNTPVSRARLVPVGGDLHFVVDLRAAVTPTWKLDEGQDKTATLAIDFPKGDYLAAPSSGTEAAAAAPPPKAARGMKRTSRPARGSKPAAPADAAKP